MKKLELVKLALLGISAALSLTACESKSPQVNSMSAAEEQPSESQFQSQEMQAFYDSLTPEAQAKFDQLDQKHQQNALDMINQSGSESSKSSCKGNGGPPVKDANKAVDIQYNNQMKGM